MSKFVAITKKYLKLAIGLAGLVIVIILSSGFLRNKVKPGYHPAVSGFPLPENAATFQVKIESAPALIEVVGTTASEEKINLSSRISAYVSEILASAGDIVKKGQVLLTLDDRDIRQQLIGAEAQLN
jgi:multidrug efflux pump subunit AcrA (membrane-fusion protein)